MRFNLAPLHKGFAALSALLALPAAKNAPEVQVGDYVKGQGGLYVGPITIEHNADDETGIEGAMYVSSISLQRIAKLDESATYHQMLEAMRTLKHNGFGASSAASSDHLLRGFGDCSMLDKWTFPTSKMVSGKPKREDDKEQAIDPHSILSLVRKNILRAKDKKYVLTAELARRPKINGPEDGGIDTTSVVAIDIETGEEVLLKKNALVEVAVFLVRIVRTEFLLSEKTSKLTKAMASALNRPDLTARFCPCSNRPAQG